MDRFTHVIRVATALTLAFVLGVAYTAVGPSAVRAQDEECLDDEELGPCVDLAASWEGIDPNTGEKIGGCIGSTCYTALEFCCLEEIVVEVPRN